MGGVGSRFRRLAGRQGVQAHPARIRPHGAGLGARSCVGARFRDGCAKLRATTAAQQLLADAVTVASFDPDALYDYRARRPTLDIVDGRIRSLAWPELHLRRTRVDGRDLFWWGTRTPAAIARLRATLSPGS